MPESRILVFETIPEVTPQLRREFADSPIDVSMATLGKDVLSQIQRRAVSCVVVAIDDVNEVLRVSVAAQESGTTSVVVVTTERNRKLQFPLQELGVVAVLSGEANANRLISICRRILS